jgi:hypothetical protein
MKTGKSAIGVVGVLILLAALSLSGVASCLSSCFEDCDQNYTICTIFLGRSEPSCLMEYDICIADCCSLCGGGGPCPNAMPGRDRVLYF